MEKWRFWPAKKRHFPRLFSCRICQMNRMNSTIRRTARMPMALKFRPYVVNHLRHSGSVMEASQTAPNSARERHSARTKKDGRLRTEEGERKTEDGRRKRANQSGSRVTDPPAARLDETPSRLVETKPFARTARQNSALLETVTKPNKSKHLPPNKHPHNQPVLNIPKRRPKLRLS